MTNAMSELEDKVIRVPSRIKCANVWYEPDDKKIQLRVGHTVGEYKKFFADLDFPYDSGYGGQVLYGTVWFEDGTWLSRGEYDGSEWWDYNIYPDIPKELEL